MDNLITTKQAAELIKISTKNVKQAYYDGRLTGRKIGNILYFDKADVLNYKVVGHRPKKGATSAVVTEMSSRADVAPFLPQQTSKPNKTNVLPFNLFNSLSPEERREVEEQADFVEKIDNLPDNKLLSVSDVARFLDISTRKVRRLIENKELNSVLLGGQHLVTKGDLIEFEDWLLEESERQLESAEYQAWQAERHRRQAEWSQLNSAEQIIRFATGKNQNVFRHPPNRHKTLLIRRITGRLGWQSYQYDLKTITDFISQNGIESILPDGVSVETVADKVEKLIQNLESEQFIENWIMKISKSDNPRFVKTQTDFIYQEIENIHLYRNILNSIESKALAA